MAKTKQTKTAAVQSDDKATAVPEQEVSCKALTVTKYRGVLLARGWQGSLPISAAKELVELGFIKILGV